VHETQIDIYFLCQKPTFTQTCPSGFKTQADDVGSTESQGRAEAETYAGWGEETEGRKEECGPRGTNIAVDYFRFSDLNRIAIYLVTVCHSFERHLVLIIIPDCDLKVALLKKNLSVQYYVI
jgi:hypothetical protein